MKMVGFPWDFSETPASWQREAPALGQHTEEILLQLGYRRDDIAKLRTEGVIPPDESAMGRNEPVHAVPHD